MIHSATPAERARIVAHHAPAERILPVSEEKSREGGFEKEMMTGEWQTSDELREELRQGRPMRRFEANRERQGRELVCFLHQHSGNN